VTAWVILAALAVAVVGVIVKVGVVVRRDLREDREAHGGRQTLAAARRAWWIIGIVLLLVLVLIVLPLLLANDADSPLG
jgi:ABC-type Fe3+ transport system permease subunit